MKKKEDFPIDLLLILAFATFAIVISELVPSGILPELSTYFGISIQKAGNFVGYYALGTAFATIPLTRLVMKINRKMVMLGIFSIYAIINFIIASTSVYEVALGARIFLGAITGAFWPIISYYALQLVNPKYGGRAITLAGSGSMIGVMLGVPTLTALGQMTSWRNVFYAMGIIAVLLVVLIYFKLPSVPGEGGTKEGVSYSKMMRHPTFLKILILTLFVVIAQYSTYVYVTQIAETMQFSGGVVGAQILYGIGTLITVVISAIWIDRYFKELSIGYLFAGGVALALMYLFPNTLGITHVVFILWGVSFGSLSSIFQTAISKTFTNGRSAANSIHSAVFNFSIMLASSVGGWIIASINVSALLIMMSIVLFVFTLFAKMSPDIFEESNEPL